MSYDLVPKKNIYKPCCKQFHVGTTIFSILYYNCQLYQCANVHVMGGSW